MNFMVNIFIFLLCNGEKVSCVYYDIMVKVLRIEFDGFRCKIVMNEIVIN